VLHAALFQKAGDGFGRNRANIQPVLAAVELGDELLGGVLVARIVKPELFNDAA
jgi:hypothetical protein